MASVACVASSSCVAVGSYNFLSQDLVVTGSPNSWKLGNEPLPAGAENEDALYSVACPTASSCLAVGFYLNSSGRALGLLLTLRG